MFFKRLFIDRIYESMKRRFFSYKIIEEQMTEIDE